MTQIAQNTPSPKITPEMVAEHGLTPDEYQRILGIMGREPNINELGIFSVMWSEHCSYKTTRLHLGKLPTKAPWVICGPGENAGVIDIGDNQAAIFKMESHNHPSYIEPFQGAATGVGGILRDVFTMGARPVANMNALRFGDPSHPKTKHLLAGVVAGIGGYGNCVGVPTVGGECNFDPSYNGNILVNAMTVGIAEQDKIFYSTAAGIGNPVVYVGSKTGRDGIHGATMASAEFDEDSDAKRPTVQVGDPFTEKLLIEACLELMQTDAIVAIQDMGAAGLTSSSLEMAGKGGLGMKLVLDDVPMREAGMTPYELMLSESQERMLMVLKPGKEHVAKEIFDKWELDCATIGELTDTGNLELWMHGECVADMPIAPISVDAPMYDRESRIENRESIFDVSLLESRISNIDIINDLKTLIASPNLASRAWIWQQYDHQVGNDTVQKPGGNAALVRVHGTDKALAISTDCTPRYCKANPVEGGKQAVAETYRNIVTTGARPLAITNCLNFGNPEKPEIMGQLVGCLQGISEACIALDYPVVSGNVSLYNDTDGESILPTPAIGGVGLLKDVRKRVPQQCSEGDVVFVLGETKGHLGQSIYQQEILGTRSGDAPHVDLATERNHGELIQTLAADGLLAACTDVSDGGLLVAIAEVLMSGNIGADLLMNGLMDESMNAETHSSAFWFGEDQGRYVLVTSASNSAAVEKAASKAGATLTKLGTIGGDSLAVDGAGAVAIADLKTAHEGWLPGFMNS